MSLLSQVGALFTGAKEDIQLDVKKLESNVSGFVKAAVADSKIQAGKARALALLDLAKAKHAVLNDLEALRDDAHKAIEVVDARVEKVLATL